MCDFVKFCNLWHLFFPIFLTKREKIHRVIMEEEEKAEEEEEEEKEEDDS